MQRVQDYKRRNSGDVIDHIPWSDYRTPSFVHDGAYILINLEYLRLAAEGINETTEAIILNVKR